MEKVTIAYIFLSLTRKQSTIEVSKKKKVQLKFTLITSFLLFYENSSILPLFLKKN